jgi:glucokinase
MVAQAAHRGDEVALAVLSRAGRALGVGLAAAVLVVDPAAIVLDGGVVNSGEPLLEPARAVLRERVLGEPPKVLISALAPVAPLYGAAAAAVDLLADRAHTGS